MAIYEMTNDSLVSLDETSFSSEKVYERKDLQRLLKDQINAVESDLLVISEEFGDWADSSRRIDLLCLDKNASLVVIELKRTEDGGHMDLQSIRYAAMISPLTFDQAVSAYDKYKQGVGGNKNESERDILSFLGWQEPLPSAFGANVRIILVSSDFSKELTTSVIWLNNNGLDIQCVRMKPYKSVDGKLFIDIQKIIPLPEAEEYQTKLINKGQESRKEKSDRDALVYDFMSKLLEKARTQSSIHANRSPSSDSWVSASIGRRGFWLTYSTRADESQVELYIDRGDRSLNVSTFEALKERGQEIEQEFGGELQWLNLENKRACRIRKVIDSGGWRSPLDKWDKIHDEMINAMVRLERAIKPYVDELPA